MGDHDLHEIIGRASRERWGLIVVGDASVDEQHIDGIAREPVAQRHDLVGLRDVKLFDRDLIVVGLREVVLLCAAKASCRQRAVARGYLDHYRRYALA
jgi:hypothetical protein